MAPQAPSQTAQPPPEDFLDEPAINLSGDVNDDDSDDESTGESVILNARQRNVLAGTKGNLTSNSRNNLDDFDASMSSITSRGDDFNEMLPLFRHSSPEKQKVGGIQGPGLGQGAYRNSFGISPMVRMPSIIQEDMPSIMPKMVRSKAATEDDINNSNSNSTTGRTDLSSSVLKGVNSRNNSDDDNATVFSTKSIKYRFEGSNSTNFFLKILKALTHRKKLKTLQLFLGIYIGVYTFCGGLCDPITGFIIDTASEERTAAGVILVNGDLRPVVAATQFQMVALGITRFSAFFMYPALALVYISKFRATLAFLASTPLSMFMDSDAHKLHVYCGYIVLVDSILHTLFHTLRWVAQGNARLLITHVTGISGLVIFTSLFVICIPMTFCKRMKYEIRKNMHYFFIFFGVALCFHAPASGVPNGGFAPYVFGTLLVWWALDYAYCNLFMTEKIETTRFDVLENGVQVTMNVSEAFLNRGAQGGYCYICVPWVDKCQWHAFSLFEPKDNPRLRQVYMQKGGDWTNKVHETLQRASVRPVYVQGPYPSPYANSDSYDNQILVASGIGITPALSVIRAHRFSRRVNLIWACRDLDLLMFFLRHMILDNHRGWNMVYYTGKKPLDKEALAAFANTNVCIINGRPDLGKIIPEIIYGIESQRGLPERYCPEEKRATTAALVDCLTSDVGSVSAGAISSMASVHGFDLKEEKASKLQKMFEFDMHSTTMSKLSMHSEEMDCESACPSLALTKQLRLGFKPWKTHRGAKAFVRNLDKQLVLPTWGICYCGGAKPVKDALKAISDEYGISLHIESFGW